MFRISNYIGVNIGSVTVNVVKISESGEISYFKRSHFGKPEEVLEELIGKEMTNNDNFFGISGSFGETSEIVAVEKAISSYDEKFDVVLSLGGEAFVLYVLDEEGHINNVLGHDKCAAGSGEFFVQQIGRLDLSLDEAIKLAHKGKRIELASRCSVHCKSDITHKLNKGEAYIEDILTSVISSMVNKVNALIVQSRVDVKRILLIGGVALNDAFVKVLKEELPEVEVVVKDVSSVFEAYGMSLIVKDDPVQKELTLSKSKSFSTLPSLKQFADQVTIIEAKGYKSDFDKLIPYVLGVDVGSTTTKAVLIDPSDSEVIASYYGRTSGNPVQATRKCIEEIISQVGNLKINLVGVTGSGRQIVGAYLGTSAVYNEISAHSEGAVFYDKDVDTIFEIGGQDSKYMYLQNEVPVDYAMNASCSAGTGSFLEESSKGDLGIHVFDISETAMESPSPVRFKADCAAFINTDIRTALQEGYGRENVIGGLVYSIADNYLNKVKGSREVGKRIFFQGGVAKNNAVGYAFAQTTGKHIIIPPNPELVGAFGIGLIAQKKLKEKEITTMPDGTNLESLIQEELKHLGSFTCKACTNYCQIERYEVGGRKFPFGGRCTRYEHQWRGSDKIEEKENLVETRNELILGKAVSSNDEKTIDSKTTIGIPRALLTHSLNPLFKTFFEELGFKTILSEIDDDMETLTNAPFCYPVQIMHGAVLDLQKKGVDYIFLPHIHQATKGDKWFESTFCPITQASPYYVSTSLQGENILIPTLNFLDGYKREKALIKMAVKEFHQPRSLARRAYMKAVKAQERVEKKFLDLGHQTLKKLEETDEIGVVLVGRSYNAFPPETSQLIPKKLSSMGVTVIPFDFLEKTSDGHIPWYFGNYVRLAIDLVKEKVNLFLLYINSFSCTIDAFVQNYVKSELNTKPYLILELDAHSADAGTQTRLEAFLEIIKNFQESTKKTKEKPFQVTKIKTRGGKTVVFTSDNTKLDVKDPRVKLYFPSFAPYHTDTFEKVLSLYGYNVGHTTDVKLEYPVEGLRHCSGKECVPLPIVLGQIMNLVRNRKPGEVIGYFMLRGGSPCAVYSYFDYINQFIENNKLEDVFIFRYDYLTNFLGMKLIDVLKVGPKSILLGDLVTEIDNALQVVGNKGSLDLLHQYWNEFLHETQHISQYDANIDKLIEKIATIPRKRDPKDLPKVLISGDFFVRFSPFFLQELKNLYAKHNIIVKSTDLYELMLYSTHYNSYLIAQLWKKDPDQLSTLLLAWASALWSKLSRMLLLGKFALKLMARVEKNQRKRFEKTGLLFAVPNDLKEIFRQSKPYISPLIFGEAIPTIGKGLETLEDSHFDSLVLTGPFNCLPYKISQAILKPVYLEHKTPFLVFDVDISAMTPNMKRLVHANIEQIKRRVE